MVLEIAALVAEVRGGTLAGLDPRRSAATARLAVEGEELGSRSEEINLKLTVPLGSGIALAAPTEGARADR